MSNKLQWKSSYHVEILEPNRVYLLTETEYTILDDPIYYLLAPLLDGRFTEAELINLLQDKVFIPHIVFALSQLKKDRHIMEVDESMSTEMTAFWHSLNVNPKTVARRLQEITVSVKSVGSLEKEPLVEILQELEIQVVADGDLEVVITDDYLQEGLEEINQQALARGRSWILVKPIGTRLWLGPVFRPGKTACWKCLAQRLEANRQLESYILKQKKTRKPLPTSRSALSVTKNLAWQMIAVEIYKTLVREGNDFLENNLVTFDILSGEMQKHFLVRRPQCLACGDSRYYDTNRSPQPIVLQSQKKLVSNDGGHRVVSPETTVNKYEHHISPITGVVSFLTRSHSESEDGLVYSYYAGHNFALMNNDLFFLIKNLRGISGGKGITDIQAKVSGICEAIERYSGIFWGDEISKQAQYKEIEPVAIHPNRLMMFSEEQYKNRLAWNQVNNSIFNRIPEIFDENLNISWTPVWSLTHSEFKYVPTAYCYYGHPDLKKSFFCPCDSNGNAAGNTKEEAVLQGLMELVERDCVALWWYNRVQRPAVDLESFNEPYFHSLQSFYKSINRALKVIDITSDLEIPAFAVISWRTDKKVEDIILGFGAHLDPKIGILRALTELNQFLPAVKRSHPDGSTNYWFGDQDAIEWWKTATIEAHPYLLPDTKVPAKTIADYAPLSSDDLFVEVQTCVERLWKQGMETLVLDQTRPDIGLSVVKVMVPGLRHFWKRFGPGRLYDVPVALNWLDKPLAEEELNPIGIFF